MKTLSLSQPWAWAVIHAGKNVENRCWRTSYRGPLLIHAAKSWDQGGFEWLLTQSPLAGQLESPTLIWEAGVGVRGGIVGQVQLVYIRRDADSPWAFPGQWHWVLRDCRPLPFTPCRGLPSLFEFDYNLIPR